MRLGLIEVSSPSTKLLDPRRGSARIESGEEFLFRELPRVRRDNSMLIYNVWAMPTAFRPWCACTRDCPTKHARPGLKS